jgi:glycosyltransferase involved in cell wall biosynthesis
MKIVHLIPNLRKGGAERLCVDTCRALQATAGTEVLLIQFSPENAYSFLTRGLNRKVIPSKVIPSMRGKSTIEIGELQQEIHTFQPDVIHVHLFESLMVASHLKFHGHLVVHFHDNMVQFENFSWRGLLHMKSLTNFFEKRLLLNKWKGKALSFIGISKTSVNYIHRVLPHYQNNTYLLHNAIDINRFRPVNRPKNETLTLITIGTLNENKNQRLAIETLHYLKGIGMEAKLIVVGDGPIRKDLEELSGNLGLGSQVNFTGSVDDPETYLGQSDMYVHTAKNEAFGLTILEAMAAGLAVVCMDGGGNRDLIRKGENGFIVPSGNVEDLVNRIVYLLKHEDQRKEMGMNAQCFAQRFDIERYTKQLIEIYS